VRRAVEREAHAWEQENGSRSQLRDEVDALGDLLAVYPLIGTRTRGIARHHRKIRLRVTGFVVYYRVSPRKRVVTIVGIAAGPSIQYG
jgi:mRNA-degrading endonuclease RelE of RelBE toxin-antitoxin system